MTSSALTLAIDVVFTFVFIGVMFFYSPTLTAIVLAAFPFYIGISAGLTPIFRQRLNDKFQRGAENQAFLVESVTGVETLKSMAVEPQMQRRWEELLAAYVTASFRVLNLSNVASQSVQLISKFVTAATLYMGAKLVISGELTVGELVAFNMLASRVSSPVLRLAQIWQDFHQARISIDRLGDILNTTPEPLFNPTRAALPEIRGDIVFEHVTFRYRVDGPEILHDISFSAPAGQIIGVVGPSGSGKSTVAKLVQRLYVPESGRVLIDGAGRTGTSRRGQAPDLVLRRAALPLAYAVSLSRSQTHRWSGHTRRCRCSCSRRLHVFHDSKGQGRHPGILGYTKGVPRAFSPEDCPLLTMQYFCESCGTHLVGQSRRAPDSVLIEVRTVISRRLIFFSRFD